MTIEELLYEVEQDLQEWLAKRIPNNASRQRKHAIKGQRIRLRLLFIMCVISSKTAGGREFR